MSAPLDWEKVLQDSRFDLPQERWDALESRLRQRIRADRQAAAVSEPTLAERFRDALSSWGSWFAPAPARWAVAGAAFGLAAFAAIAWLRPQSPVQTAAATFAWTPGQTLVAQGEKRWEWSEGRTSIVVRDGSVRLDSDSSGQVRIHVQRGTATFDVDHRAPSESFHVGFGSCRIEVVGTRFTIVSDSLESSARVLEGRVRFVGAGRDALLDAGQELSCRPAVATAVPAAPDTVATTPAAPVHRVAPAPAAATPAAPSAADLAFASLDAACQAAGPACTDARADFVRRFPSDPRATEVAWSWGQAAKEAGDLRDALFAWDVASRRTDKVGQRATLAACELRMGPLPDAEAAARSLDALLPRLDPGSTLWTRGWTLRRDAARALGQTAMLQKAESLLAAPSPGSGSP